jgi:hypothetical protein
MMTSVTTAGVQATGSEIVTGLESTLGILFREHWSCY